MALADVDTLYTTIERFGDGPEPTDMVFARRVAVSLGQVAGMLHMLFTRAGESDERHVKVLTNQNALLTILDRSNQLNVRRDRLIDDLTRRIDELQDRLTQLEKKGEESS